MPDCAGALPLVREFCAALAIWVASANEVMTNGGWRSAAAINKSTLASQV